MKNIRQLKTWILGAAVLIAAFAGSAMADPIDIHVSINASKSLQVLTTTYNFGAVDINSSSYSATSLTVRNTSGALIETYKLSAGDAISDVAGTDWVLDTTASQDHYVLSAQFSANRPGDALDATWTTDNLTTSPTDCGDQAFGNTTHTEAGNGVSPDSTGNAYDRKLWFRIKTPTIATDGGRHTALVTISVK